MLSRIPDTTPVYIHFRSNGITPHNFIEHSATVTDTHCCKNCQGAPEWKPATFGVSCMLSELVLL